MRKIIVGFSKPKSIFKPFAWLIRWYEGTPFSHVYMKHHSEKYDCDLIYQASGAQVNFMSEANFNHSSVTLEEYEFDVTDQEFDTYMAWAIRNAGAPYSLKKVLEIVFKKDIWPTDEPQWVCSVLAAFAIKSKIIGAFNWQLATPKDIKELCLVYGKRVS